MTRRKCWHGSAVVLGLAVCLIFPLVSRAQATEDTQSASPATEQHSEERTVAPPKKNRGAQLAIVVLGDGKPIRDAEVKIKFPPHVGGDETRPTDEGGEASFESTGTGLAKVRVLCEGWESTLQEVKLKEGSQTLTIKLRRSEL